MPALELVRRIARPRGSCFLRGTKMAIVSVQSGNLAVPIVPGWWGDGERESACPRVAVSCSGSVCPVLYVCVLGLSGGKEKLIR